MSSFPQPPSVPKAPFESRRFEAGGLEIRPLKGPGIKIPGDQALDLQDRFTRWKAEHGYPVASLPEFLTWEFLTYKKKQIEGVDFCPTPGHRVLTRDLRWVPIESLQIGDEVISFDDVPFYWKRRHWDCGVVESNELVEVDNLYRITLEDGTELTATGEHRWLTTYDSRNGLKNQTHTWVRTDQIIPNKHPLIRFFHPWDSEETWESGWLAGMFDGEGCLTWVSSGKRNSYSMSLSLAQKEGPAMDHVKSALVERGFAAKVYNAKTLQLHVQGGFSERMRLLGTVRPQRLIEKSYLQHWGSICPIDRPKVVSVKPVGRGKVCALSVSTGTYVLEGFGAHNTYQSNVAGGRTEFGGFVVDFYLILKKYVWNIQGERWHIFFPKDRARDQIAKAILEGQGITVLFLREDDILGRPDLTFELAWEGRQLQYTEESL